MLIDTHAHLNDERYTDILEMVINESREQGVKIVINPGVDFVTSLQSVKLAEDYDFIYAAVGYHPHEAKEANSTDWKEIEKLIKHPKVVAIGEIGLDYYYEYSQKDVQKLVFERQLNLAKKVDLPVIIHSRDAHQDTFEILNRNKEGLRAVLHSYSGSWEMAKRYLDLGFYISFSGPITFKNAHKLPEIAQKVPLDRLLIETDSPYLTPVPFRGKTNHPIYVRYVAEEICRIRQIDFETLMENVRQNTLQLFTKVR